MGPRYVIRDDCDEMGRTYVARWRITGASFARSRSSLHDVEADWTVVREDALVFDNRDVARLVAKQVGGVVLRVKTKPPTRIWIEFSDDGMEVLATHGSAEEAEAGFLRGSMVGGPYVLEGS